MSPTSVMSESMVLFVLPQGRAEEQLGCARHVCEVGIHEHAAYVVLAALEARGEVEQDAPVLCGHHLGRPHASHLRPWQRLALGIGLSRGTGEA